MAKRKRIKFEAYSIHGFVEGKPADYQMLFERLAALKPEQRMAVAGGAFGCNSQNRPGRKEVLPHRVYHTAKCRTMQ
jgi:hypothetical protein